MRLIDGDELKTAFPSGEYARTECVRATIDHMADAVKRGKWEEQTVDSYEENAVITDWQSAKCSVCERYLTTPYLYYFNSFNFCPNCGAKMVGKAKEGDSE